MERVTHSPEETRRLGQALGVHASIGHFFALTGPLGAGKTCFAQAILAGLGVTGQVTSPTFTLMVEYQGRLPVVHVDAYRLSDPEELLLQGWDDYLIRGAVMVVEWADRLGDLLPQDRLDIEIDYWNPPGHPGGTGPDSRLIKFIPRGPQHRDLLERALGTGDGA